MLKPEDAIPYYSEINDLLISLSLDIRTRNPFLYCLRLKEGERSIYKPPFKRGFYFVALLSKAEKTKIAYDTTNINNLGSLLLFQPPNLVYSFYRDSDTHGYLIYFKPECFSFFKPTIEKEFPFFDNLHTDFLEIDTAHFTQLKQHFEEVFTAYENSNDDKHIIACLKLLALLYIMKNMAAFNLWQERVITPQQDLFKKFIRLVSNHYIEKRTIDEYAQLLFVTPNYLSKSVKSASGKNALSFINERLLAEAKSLISYTAFDMAEIAYRLNFSDPSNFANFFKKHTGFTPLEYRKKK